MPSGLARSEAILATCLPVPAPTEATSPVSSRTLDFKVRQNASTSSADAPASSAGSPKASSNESCSRTGTIGTHGVEYAAARHAVDDAARRQHHGSGAHHAAGLVHGHRRSGAEHPGLVARARDHAATAEPADQDRPATQGGPGQLLDRREERVHVEVHHPAVHALINQSIRRKPAMNTTTYIVPDSPTPQNVPIPVSVANVDDWQHHVPLPYRTLSGELRNIDGGSNYTTVQATTSNFCDGEKSLT